MKSQPIKNTLSGIVAWLDAFFAFYIICIMIIAILSTKSIIPFIAIPFAFVFGICSFAGFAAKSPKQQKRWMPWLLSFSAATNTALALLMFISLGFFAFFVCIAMALVNLSMSKSAPNANPLA